MKIKKTQQEILEIINDPKADFANIKGKTYVQLGNHVWNLEGLIKAYAQKEGLLAKGEDNEI